MSDNVKKTGIFGGAFNPVHNGHVRLAEEAVKQLKLRRLLIIPTCVSPHKHTELLPYEDRAEMCRRAFGHIPGAEISDIEVRLGGTSYTINTVRALKELYPDEQLFLIIGGDMLFSFEKWYKYESLLKETRVCAAAPGRRQPGGYDGIRQRNRQGESSADQRRSRCPPPRYVKLPQPERIFPEWFRRGRGLYP